MSRIRGPYVRFCERDEAKASPYSMSLYHLQFGVQNIGRERVVIEANHIARISQKLEKVDYIFSEDDKTKLNDEDVQFLVDCRRATTDTAVRIRRSEYLLDLMV